MLVNGALIDYQMHFCLTCLLVILPPHLHVYVAVLMTFKLLSLSCALNPMNYVPEYLLQCSLDLKTVWDGKVMKVDPGHNHVFLVCDRGL